MMIKIICTNNLKSIRINRGSIELKRNKGDRGRGRGHPVNTRRNGVDNMKRVNI